MSGFDIAGGLKNLLPGSLDSLRGPYATVAAANLAIPNTIVGGESYRKGKFVEIGSSAPYVTYWWSGTDYADDKLVEYLNGTASWINTNYTSGRRVTYQGRLWKSTSAISSGEVPGTSPKWSPDLNGYAEEARIISKGKNLADFSKKYDDAFVSSTNGAIGSNTSYTLIRISNLAPSTVYYRSHQYQMAFFDNNDQFISGLAATDGLPGTFTTPTNVSYALFSVVKIAASAFMVMLDSNPDKTYIPYQENIKASLNAVKTTDLINYTGDDSLFTVNVNQFNKDTVIADKFINWTTGAENTGLTYVASDWIKILPSTVYTRSNALQCAFYDINKVYISGISTSDGLASTITSPYNAYYFRSSVLKTYLSTFQFVKGSSVPAYSSFKGFIKNSVLPQTSVQKTDFIVVGNNIFNPADANIAIGQYVNNTNGVLAANAAYNSTGFMQVIGGQSYTMSYKHNIAWYDINKNYISGSSSTDTNKTQVAPATAFYLRATVLAAQWSTFMINKGASLLNYETYRYVFKSPDNVPIIASSDSVSQFSSIECAIPAKTYVLKGRQNSIYFDQLTNKLKTNEHFVRASGQGYICYDRFARVTNPLTSGALSLQIFNEDFGLILSKSTSIVIGDPAVDNGAITLNSMGDSFTYNGSWQSIIRQLISNITFTGMRRPYSDSLLRNEGRGGWTLSDYFTVLHTTTGAFSPFLHPSGYLYYGNTDFWKKVVANDVSYNYEGFKPTADAIGFTSLGFKTTPAVNDLMYDDVAAVYKYWNGTAWTTVSLIPSDFSFNYAKYRQTWGIPSPTYFSSMLGVNDFFDMSSKTDVDTTFATWKTRIDTVIASVKADTPAVKYILMLPNIDYGKMDNEGAVFTKMKRFFNFYARKLMIDTYDLREAESIYVIDGGACVDPEYGYVALFTSPFTGYVGTETRKTHTNSPHPSNEGYAQLGIPVASFIQKTR